MSRFNQRRHRKTSPFLALEERILLAAQPVVAISGQAEVQLGESTSITLTFDNQPDASPGDRTGFAPYIDLVLSQNGADGSGPGNLPPNQNDGISFAGASFLGQAVHSTVIEFDATGEATHPLARDSTGALRIVRAADYGAAPGDQLVVLQLPFGSFTPEQTPVSIAVNLTTSPLADVGTPLPITAVGGFAFGRDPLNNPTTDPPILGTPAQFAITPTLLQLSKSFSGADGETATGPNFPRSYLLNLDVATGQTLTNLVFRDQLADGLVITGASIVAGPAGMIALDPATSDITVTFGAPLVGIAGTDVTVRVDFYVGEFLAPGQPTTPVLDPATGAPRTIANELSATADWLPLDPRDPITPVIVDPPGPENVFTARSLAVQKTALVIGGGAPEPGDIVRWTLSAQLSDYFSADGLVMNDRLSDGQLPMPASPILTVREGGRVIYTGVFDAANVTIVRNADGTSDLAFRIADELALRGLDPSLSGGRVGPPTGPTTAAVTFDSQVQRFYADGRPLLQGDSIGNTVNGGATLPGTGTQIGDLGSAGLVLDRGQQLEKTVFKINGLDPAGPVPAVTSSDTVTFRLRYLLPTGSTDNFTLTDFLPLPVLLSQGATGPITFLDIRNDGSDPNTIPPVGTAWFHPDDTFDLANPIGYAGTPTVIVDAAANSVTFDFGDFFMETPQPLQVDILFRLRVEDQPFGDNLFLTNLVTSRESNTSGQVATDNAIAQINVTQPLLNVSKGVVGVATGQTTFPTAFDPTATGPVVFTPPGTAGTPFAGIVNSAALDANPIDSNLANVDAGDLVRFAIVVENTGSGIRGAHDILIQDILPAGYVVPQGGLNLSVTRGDGQVLAFTLEGNGLFDPAGGLRITDPTDSDPDNLEGALTRFTTTSPAPGVPPTAPTGSNLAIIVFDLRVADTTAANGLTLTNVAGIENYAAQDGGRNFAPNLLDEDRFDDAVVTTGDLAIDKALIATSLPQSTDPFVFIGEEVTFRVVATIREGTTQDLVLADLLPTTPGVLSLLDWRITNLGTNISFTGAPPPVGSPQTGAVTINLGDVTNLADNFLDARDTIVFEVRARIDDLPQNNRGDVLTNTATATFTDGTGAIRDLSDTDSVTIAEPAPQLTKTADRATADGGDVVTYTVEVRNPVTGGTAAPLFDLDIRDLLDDPDLALVAGSVALAGSGAANASIVLGNGTADTAIRVTSTQLDPGAELRITYQVRISDTVQAGRVVPNTATLQGDSAPGTVPSERIYQDLDTESVSIIAPQLAKTVLATSLPETGNGQGDPNRPDLAFGEEVTFRLDARFSEGTTANASIADLLPIGPAPLELLSARIVAVGGSLSAPGALVGNTGVAGDRNGDGFNDNVAFALGTLVNRPDGIANAGDVITIEVVARLRGDAGAAGGLVLTNQGELDFTSQGEPRSVTAQAAVETVLPWLAIDKSPDRATADGGDMITYTVRLTNQSGAFAAPAFDLAVADLITDPNLRLVAGSVTAAGVPATIVNGNDPGDTQIRITLDALAVGQVLTITYQARVADLVPAGSRLDNTASYAGDTYPGVQPGEATLSGSDDARVLVGTPGLTKEVIATSLPETGSGAFNPNRPDAAIGETVTYRVTLSVPEGSSIDLRLVDQLPAGAGVMEFLAYRIVPLPSTTNLDFVPGTETASATDTNGDGRLDRIELGFGTVINTPDNVSDADDLILVEVTGRVIDASANVAGRVLTNSAQTFLGTTAQDPVSASVDVVEPQLVIGKTSSLATGDAGDVTTFTLTIGQSPGASGPAFNVRVADLLPVGLLLVPGSVVLAPGAGTVLSGNGASDTGVSLLLNTILPGEPALTVTFQARLADTVEPQQELRNTADLDYQSAPDFQRNYEGTAIANLRAVLNPVVAKDVVTTSLPETGFEFNDPNAPDVAVGEIITYRILATIGEGTQTLVLNDALPGGGNLRVLTAVVDSIGANITGGLLAVGDAGSVAGNAVTFNFGTVVNEGDNVSDARDQVAVLVRARVADIPANVANVALENTGSAVVGAPSDPTVRIERSDTARVEVVEPLLQIIKDADLSAGDAGDIITYRLTVSNLEAATGPAYDLQLADVLPAAMRLVAGSVTTDRGTVAQGNAPGDTAIRVDLTGIALLPRDNPLTPGLDDTRVVVTYQARLEDTVEPGQALTNDARFSGVTSPPGSAGPDARPLAGGTSDTVRVTMPVQLDKAIVATSNPGTPGSSLAVGETVTYRLTATLSEGTQTLVIRDLLPAGLEFVAGRVAAVGAGLPPGLLATQVTANGQQVVADFGTVVNTGNNIAGDGTVAIEITARVADVPGNQPGTVLTNTGSATVTSPTNPGAPGGTLTDTDGTTAEVVGPALLLDKVAPPGFARPGEVLTYTLTLQHAPNSTSAAYDITIADALTDANLVLVGGSVQSSAGTVVIGNGAADRAISVTLDELALGQVVTVTFQATVAAGAPGGATLENTATTEFDSNPGPGGRPGTIADTAEVPLAPGFVKQLADTSLPETTGGDFAIGEVVTYRVTTTVPLGALVGLTVSDLLPAGLTPLSATVISVGSGITGAALAPGAAGIITGQAVRFAFGDVVNGSPPAIDAADRIVVEITARVADVAGNQAGTPLTNDAELSYTIGGEPGTDGSSVPGSVVTPALDIGKTVDRLTGDAGDVFTYTVTITPGGTGPAYDVVVVDTLDGVLMPIGVSTSFGTASFNGQVIRLEIPVLLPTDAPVVLTYQVRFADTIQPGRIVGNVAGLDFSTAPGGPGGGGRPGEESANGPDLTAVFDLDLTKAIIATSIPETRAGFFDPALPDLAIGEVVTYELVTTLSEGTQRVVLRDVIPEGLAFLPGTFTVSTGGSISAGAGGTLAPTPALAGRTASLDFGTLVNAGDNVSDAGDRITVRFQAIALDDPANDAGRLLRNDADVTASAITAPSVPGGTLTDAAFADAEIVTGMLALEKAVVPIAGDAGDVFTYTLTLDHLAGPASTAPAFLVMVVDSLPGTLILDAGSITASLGNATAVGNTVQIEIPVLLPGDPPVTVTYQARLADGIEPGQVVPNNASVTYVSAPGAVSRPGFDDASASINGVGAVTLTKAIVDTSLPGTGGNFFDPNRPDLAIGEVVTYRLVATISEGTARLVIADLLPAGLVPETALVTLVGVGLPAGLAGIAGVINGQAVTFDFGTIVNTGNNVPADNSITVEVTARVADVAGNQAGTLLVNGAVATLTSPTNPGAPGGTLTSGDSTGADVVTPVLVIDKAADRAFATLGETITYTLVLTHAPGSTAPAYNVELSDPLTGGALRLVAGSVSTSVGTVTSGNGGADTAVRVSVAELDVGQSVTVTFRATATAVPPPDGNAPNIGTFNAASAPGGPPGFVRAFTGSDDAVVRISSAFTGGGTAGLASEIEDFLARERAILAQPLTITPIYSGTAQPGTAITLAARDGSGEIVGLETRLADTGGNWLVPLPAVGTTPVAPDNTGTLQASIPIMRDRDLGLNAGLPEVSRPDVPNANAGGGLVVTPAQAAPLSASATQGPDSTRIYFAGPLSPTTFGSGPADALSGARALGVSAVAPDVAGMSRPYGLALNKFALDFLAGSTVPSGRLN